MLESSDFIFLCAQSVLLARVNPALRISSENRRRDEQSKIDENRKKWLMEKTRRPREKTFPVVHDEHTATASTDVIYGHPLGCSAANLFPSFRETKFRFKVSPDRGTVLP